MTVESDLAELKKRFRLTEPPLIEIAREKLAGGMTLTEANKWLEEGGVGETARILTYFEKLYERRIQRARH